MPLAFADTLTQVARGALTILVAVLAIYLALRLLGKIAKFVITIVVIVAVIYIVFFATDLGQTLKEAIMSLPFWSAFAGKGA